MYGDDYYIIDYILYVELLDNEKYADEIYGKRMDI